MRLVFASVITLLAVVSYGQEIEYGIFCRQNAAGDYSVKTVIILNADQTFEYEFTGHMIRDKAKGTFSVSKNSVIKLSYDTSGLKDQNEKEIIDMAPKVMNYENGRLYEVDKNGKAIKTKRLLSRYRRFYLLGSYSRRKDVFLEKKDGKKPCE